MKLYMAGGLFSSAEIELNMHIAALLRTTTEHEVFLPQETEENLRVGEAATARAIFDSDVFGLDWADMVVANIDGPDPDSGTSWELGYAYAKGKPSILYRTDFRTAGDFDGCVVNLMLAVPAYRTLLLPKAGPSTITRAIDKAIAEFQKGVP